MRNPEDAASADFKLQLLPGRLDVVDDLYCHMDEIGGMTSCWQNTDHGQPTCNCKPWAMMDARQCCASGVGARELVKHWRGTGG
eukprot:3807176-Alexandrium_andersonii.AAC.1